MSTPIKDGGPAFPVDTRESSYHDFGGMNLREYAAIKLRVPESGTEWLDNMIRSSLRGKLAAQAMQGFTANANKRFVDAPFVLLAELAYEQADAMLAAREVQS